jgi:DNA-binding NarL/FixJ family response regulator
VSGSANDAPELVLPGSLRVLLIDERAVLRNGLRASLGSEGGIEVVGAARTFAEALRIAAQTDPQLIVSDLQVAGRPVNELVEALGRARSQARVLVLASQASEAQLRRALSAGVRAYLLKDDGYAELLEALRVVSLGRRFFSDTVESRILARYAERVAARVAESSAPLTAREREVLARIGQGQTNKGIAKALHLSVKTVEKHRSNLMRKLGLHNTAAVTVYAMRQGLVNQGAAADDGP